MIIERKTSNKKKKNSLGSKEKEIRQRDNR